MKQQCFKVTVGLIIELEKCFHVQELFNTSMVIYLEYWFVLKTKIIFLSQMAILHGPFGYKKPIGGFSVFVGPIINHLFFINNLPFSS
jgi:hypothetical protein